MICHGDHLQFPQCWQVMLTLHCSLNPLILVTQYDAPQLFENHRQVHRIMETTLLKLEVQHSSTCDWNSFIFLLIVIVMYCDYWLQKEDGNECYLRDLDLWSMVSFNNEATSPGVFYSEAFKKHTFCWDWRVSIFPSSWRFYIHLFTGAKMKRRRNSSL